MHLRALNEQLVGNDALRTSTRSRRGDAGVEERVRVVVLGRASSARGERRSEAQHSAAKFPHFLQLARFPKITWMVLHGMMLNKRDHGSDPQGQRCCDEVVAQTIEALLCFDVRSASHLLIPVSVFISTFCFASEHDSLGQVRSTGDVWEEKADQSQRRSTASIADPEDQACIAARRRATSPSNWQEGRQETCRA